MSAVDDTLKSLLLELTELAPAEREQRLRQLRETAPERAAAVAPLLADALATLPALKAPRQWLQALQGSGLPERLGPWRVRHEIGRGGMGVVLLGERADGAFDRRVAIKVLPPALVGASATARLAAEARMLARLEHPHIARLLDAGFDGGCAWLAMEHVEGTHLIDHARSAGLDGPRRVQLLLQLATAVQFAHAQLLVHRDLKPANVMVDREGRVRLLDFGIAKVLEGGDDAALSRQAGCTPAYASPEQLLGQPVSVASDVFSFGALAFELLVGSHPFRVGPGGSGGGNRPTPDVSGGGQGSGRTGDGGGNSSSPGDAAPLSDTLATVRAVLEQPPDARALAAARVPADLRAILLKALEKEPTRRYASVEALAGDLQAFLDGRPVSAQLPRWTYHARRFVLRHRWAVGGAGLATAAVLGFAGWALWSADEARRQQAVAQQRLEAVRSIANKVVFDYNRALEPLPGTLELRRTLVADALGYLDALSREAAGDAALLADVAAGFEAVGDVQGRGATGGNLGDLAGAQRSYERARALREPACAAGRVAPAALAAALAAPGTAAASATTSAAATVTASATASAATTASAPASASGAASATVALAAASATAATPGASAAATRPVALAALPPPPRSACVALARTLVRLGDNAFTQGRLPQALPHFDQALAAAEQALAAAGGDAALALEAQDARFDAVQRLAGVSVRQTGEAYARGLPLAHTQLAAAQALVALRPDLKALENLRVAQDFMAMRLLADGRPDAALPAVREAIATARRLQALRPGRDATVYLTASLSRLAEIQAHRLQPAEARAAVRESVDLLWALHRAEPDDRHLRARLANIGRRFGQVHNLIGDAPALQANATELPALLAVSAVFTPADGVFFVQHQQLQLELAETLLRRGDAAAALAPLAGLPPTLPPNPRAAADLAEGFVLRAQVLQARGDLAGAWASLQPALQTLQAQVAATPTLVPARGRLAQAQLLAARWLEAAPQAAPETMAGVDAAALRGQAQATVRALADAGQLTPWWRQTLAAR